MRKVPRPSPAGSPPRRTVSSGLSWVNRNWPRLRMVRLPLVVSKSVCPCAAAAGARPGAEERRTATARERAGVRRARQGGVTRLLIPIRRHAVEGSRRAGPGKSDGHDLRLLLLQEFVQLLDGVVGELLHLDHRRLLVVLADLVVLHQLLQVVVHVAA